MSDIPPNPDLTSKEKIFWKKARQKIQFFDKNRTQPLRTVRTTSGPYGILDDLRREEKTTPVVPPPPTDNQNNA